MSATDGLGIRRVQLAYLIDMTCAFQIINPGF